MTFISSYATIGHGQPMWSNSMYLKSVHADFDFDFTRRQYASACKKSRRRQVFTFKVCEQYAN